MYGEDVKGGRFPVRQDFVSYVVFYHYHTKQWKITETLITRDILCSMRSLDCAFFQVFFAVIQTLLLSIGSHRVIFIALTCVVIFQNSISSIWLLICMNLRFWIYINNFCCLFLNHIWKLTTASVLRHHFLWAQETIWNVRDWTQFVCARQFL